MTTTQITTQITTITATVAPEWFGDFAAHYDVAALNEAYRDALESEAREVAASVTVAANGMVFADVEDADAARDINWAELAGGVDLDALAFEHETRTEDEDDLRAALTPLDVVQDVTRLQVGGLRVTLTNGTVIHLGETDGRNAVNGPTPRKTGFDGMTYPNGDQGEGGDQWYWPTIADFIADIEGNA